MQTSQQGGIERFEDGPQSTPHYAERRQSLSSRCKFLQVVSLSYFSHLKYTSIVLFLLPKCVKFDGYFPSRELQISSDNIFLHSFIQQKLLILQTIFPSPVNTTETANIFRQYFPSPVNTTETPNISDDTALVPFIAALSYVIKTYKCINNLIFKLIIHVNIRVQKTHS